MSSSGYGKFEREIISSSKQLIERLLVETGLDRRQVDSALKGLNDEVFYSIDDITSILKKAFRYMETPEPGWEGSIREIGKEYQECLKDTVDLSLKISRFIQRVRDFNSMGGPD